MLTILIVGGSSESGKLLEELILYQTSLENEVPKVGDLQLVKPETNVTQLKEGLPEIEIEAIDSGLYYINLHIITGRKPLNHRLGDLLPDGTRQEMTDSKCDEIRCFDGGKTQSGPGIPSSKPTHL